MNRLQASTDRGLGVLAKHISSGVVVQESDELLYYIRSRVADPEDALDVLQDVWLRAIVKVHTYDGRGEFRAWLRAIARNTCRMRFRRSRLESSSEVSERVQRDWYRLSSALAPPDIWLERQELGRAFAVAFSGLARRQRDTAALRLVEGRSTRDTADLLGCTTGTVKANLSRAVRRLRVKLEDWRP